MVLARMTHSIQPSELHSCHRAPAIGGRTLEPFTSSVIPVPRVILPAFDTGVETLALISEATPQRTIEPNAALLAGVFEGRKL